MVVMELKDAANPLTLPRRRPGRPRLQDIVVCKEDADSTRKSRQRLAQRTYRSRKQNALAVAQARTAKLENALASTLETMNKFQKYVVENSGGRVPADILLQLTKTAAEISAAARQGQDELVEYSGESHLIEPSPEQELELAMARHPQMLSRDGRAHGDSPDVPEYIISCGYVERITVDPNSMANRMLSACFERYKASIRAGMSGELGVLSVLIMTLLPKEDYRMLELRAKPTRDSLNGFWSDFTHPQSTERVLPKTYRIVEGDYGVRVARRSPPNLQRLQFGRTRTILQTELLEMQGEWLEASDVEEYLAERGIYLRAEDSSNLLELGLMTNGFPNVPPDGGGHAFNVHQELNDNALLDTHSSGNLPSGDFSVFGFRGETDPRPLPSGIRDFQLSSRQYVNLTGELQPMHEIQMVSSKAASQAVSSATRVTVNLDKLISVLADNSKCLGVGPGVRRSVVDQAIRESMAIQ